MASWMKGWVILTALAILLSTGAAASAGDELSDTLPDLTQAQPPATLPLTPPNQPLPPRGPAPATPKSPAPAAKSAPATTTPEATTPAPVAPTAPTAPAPQPAANPEELALAPTGSPNALDSSSSGYDLASVPDMIGDAPGVKYMLGHSTLALAGGDRGLKIAEDSRPLPTDRVFFDFNYFKNANTTADGATIGLDRYTIGFEKTFFDGHVSIEVRAPIDTGLNRRQSDFSSTSANEGTMFGDMTITPKALLAETSDFALAIGVTVGLPTSPGEDYFTTIYFTDITLTIHNDSVHVAPFVGWQFAPGERFFATGYLQFDFDSNGDRVSEVMQQETETGDPLIGRLRTPTLMYTDLSTGYWLYHDRPGDCGEEHRFITGVAPIFEVHYTAALQDAHSVGLITPIRDRINALDMTVGVDFQLGRLSTLTIADAFPLRTRSGDQLFTNELIAQFNRRF